MNDVAAWLMGLIAAVVPGLGAAPAPEYHGYIEADFVYVAAASAGRIERMAVAEGDVIEAGALLFSLETESQAASLRAAEAREAVAEAEWRNLETGSREEETAVIRASLAKAEADRDLAETTLERSRQLVAQGFVSEAKLDADRTALEAAKAQVAQLEAQLQVAELPARDAQLVAAKAALEAARADADGARAELADRSVAAPAGGLVERVFFRAGEVASAGTPVVSLLPPGALKARFFIPERDRSRFRTGEELALSCDGCAAGLRAVLTRLASEPQHTPPVIYSREERDRLVFMAEAKISGDSGLLPGQPVTLRVLP